MTNGEKIQQDFKCEVCEPIIEDNIIHVIFADKPDSAIGFDWDWWNAEYKEPTTKNDLAVDCIARQDVERYIEGFINEYTSKEELEFINLELDGLKHLPSVTPQLSSELAKNSKKLDCISRTQAQTEIEMNASRYTIAKERGGMGQVEWSDQLIKVSDTVDIIRHLPSATPQEPEIVPIAEIKFDEGKLKELVDKAVLTVTPQEPTDKNFTKADIDAIVKVINKGWELRINEIFAKIRAELEHGKTGLDIEFNGGIDYGLSIIDKHMAETEN